MLASQTFVLPHNDYQFAQLHDSLLGLVGVGVGVVIVMAMLMRRYLPHTPFFSNVMLEPPSDAETRGPGATARPWSISSICSATRDWPPRSSPPRGKARFGNELVDVIADGEVIGRGTAVVVVEVHGNRVVVRSAGNHA